jgi:hypothetical protein
MMLRAWDGEDVDGWKGTFAPPKKVTVEYRDAFDLMDQCSTECRLYWEYSE